MTSTSSCNDTQGYGNLELLRQTLAPFLESDDWTLHYPLAINTFVLAHHLSAIIQTPEKIKSKFVMHDWDKGLPRFTYKTPIEIFVGTKETVNEMITAFGNERIVVRKFTSYNLAYIYFRSGFSCMNPEILVTDIRENAKYIRNGLLSGDVSIVDCESIEISRDIEIREANKRRLDDIFCRKQKSYLFSASLCHVLRNQKDEKYIEKQLKSDSIPTFYIARYPSSRLKGTAESMVVAIDSYYQWLFSVEYDEAEREIGDKIAEQYSKLCFTYGQPNPFPEFYSIKESGISTEKEEEIRSICSSTRVYHDLLKRHHRDE